MQCTLRYLLAALLLAVASLNPATAQPQSMPIPAPPSLGAESYILLDYHSGRVLVNQNSDKRRDPASLTKLMTAYVVFNELRAGNLSMDEKVLISEKAWRANGSRMFIEVGNRVRVEDLLKGVIIQSGNDASIALAEHIAGTEETFAQVMNQYAEQLGMNNTHYTNSNGLPSENHYTTARDTAILARALISDFPDFYDFYSQRSFEWADIKQPNRNKLLWRNPAVDGLKTGYTEDAGYCLASSAEKEGMRLISVLMGASSPGERIEQSQALLSYGFRFYSTHRLYTANEPITRATVWKGAAETAPLGVTRDVYVTIPKREYDNLEASMSVDRMITAPVPQGSEFGRVTVELQGETLADTPLVALEGVATGSLWTRLVDSVWLWFE